MRAMSIAACCALFAALTIGAASAAPSVDGSWSVGEWDSFHWFTDSSAGPGTGYDDDPLPVFDGYLTWDPTSLYLGFDVQDNTQDTNRDFLYVTFDVGTVGLFDSPVDALYWGSVPSTASFFGEAYLTGDDYPWDRSQRTSTWGPDGGVQTGRSIASTNRYYEMQVPWAALHINDTAQDFCLGLKVQARDGDYPSFQYANYYPDMPDGITPIRSDTRVEVPGNFAQLCFAGGHYGAPPTQLGDETPELATWALLMATGAVGGLIRRRRA